MRIARALTASVLFLAVPTLVAGAQGDETLIRRNFESGGAGGPTVALTRVKGEAVVLQGGSGAWIVDRKLLIGGGGYRMVTSGVRTGFTATDGSRPQLELAYGGLMVGLTSRSNKLVHATAAALFGGGQVAYAGHSGSDGLSDHFMVFEPQVSLELNVSEWMRVAAGGSYRVVTDAELPNLSASDLRGPSAILTFRFGKF